MATRLAFALLGSATLVLGACSSAGSGSSQAADSVGDSSDTTCQIILRSAGHQPGTEGPVAQTSNGTYIWNATADLSNALIAQGAAAELYWSDDNGAPWTAITGTQATGAPDGFTRFSFTFDDLYPASSQLSNGDVYVIPFALLSNGARLFDHNVNSDPSSNYDLPTGNVQPLTTPANVCPAKGASVCEANGGTCIAANSGPCPGETQAPSTDSCSGSPNGVVCCETPTSNQTNQAAQAACAGQTSGDACGGAFNDANVLYSCSPNGGPAYDLTCPNGCYQGACQ